MAHPSIKEGHADVSSAACETYAAANATMEFLRLSYITDEIGRPMPVPFVLEMDNAAPEVFAKNTAAKFIIIPGPPGSRQTDSLQQ